MKLFSRKNKKDFNTQEGFAALFSVLVSSVLLIMALAISGVAYKEQLFSINAKASQYSFMAADSGMECALLWDVKNDWFNTNSANDPAGIDCGDGGRLGYMNDVSTNSLSVYEFSVTALVNGNTIPSCSVFSINKDYDDDGDGIGDSTKIDSRGYNVDCADIEFGPSQGGSGLVELQFQNGTGKRAVERFLGAIYSNS